MCPPSQVFPEKEMEHDRLTGTHLHGLWLPLVTPFRDGALDETSLRRLTRHYSGTGRRRLHPGRDLRRRHDAARRRARTPRRHRARRDGGRPPHVADLPRPFGRGHLAAEGAARRDRGLADRRLSDREPLLRAAVAARHARAFRGARRSRRLAARALQHPLSQRRSTSPTRPCCGLPSIRTSSA